MIHIKKLNKEALLNYILSEEFTNAPVVSISKQRANSQINNPKAKNDDFLMFMAYESEEMVGYLGVLPDDIMGAQKRLHCGWMSCLWVDTKHRGKKIAQQLIKAAMESWNYNILLTEYTEAAGNLYDKMGIFTLLGTKIGKRWYIKSELSRILPQKKPIFQKMLIPLKLIDKMLNIVLSILYSVQKANIIDYSYKFIDKLDSSVVELIESKKKETLFNRRSNDIKWILEYPWVIEDSKNEDSKRYHFTSEEEKFISQGLKILNKKGEITAIIIFTNRNGHLRISYYFYKDNLESVRQAIRYLIKFYKIKTCTIFAQELIDYFNEKPLWFALNKSIHRNYLVTHQLFNQLDSNINIIYDGDGDCAFT